jgi:hypothetical protein
MDPCSPAPARWAGFNACMWARATTTAGSVSGPLWGAEGAAPTVWCSLQWLQLCSDPAAGGGVTIR